MTTLLELYLSLPGASTLAAGPPTAAASSDGLAELPGRVSDVLARIVDVLLSGAVLWPLIGVVFLVVVTWLWSTKRTLDRRVRWQVLPASDFDPSEEQVARFASSLGRCVRRGPVGRMSRSGCAVRVRLSAAGSGRMTYELEVPRHAVSVVRSALYTGADLEDPQTVDLAAPAASPASPEEGAAGAVAPPGEADPAALEWAHTAEGEDVGQDFTHDLDPGAERHDGRR